MMVILASLFGIICRSVIGLWDYSGAKHPPMFGDFEAQRHWLEITTHLHIQDWYRHTVLNDLQYWGLDYPPLTAYVSFVFGKIAELLYPKMVALTTSRGIETIETKLFMRVSVIVSDLVVFFPAVFAMIYGTNIVMNMKKEKSSEAAKSSSASMIASFITVLSLICPGLMLIDHGHFQYNAVCIGLTLLASYYVINGHRLLGSVFFCLSLNFKQMALYYAPIFFFSLLRTCKSNSWIRSLVLLVALGVPVILTFGILWLPFCLYPASNETCQSSLLIVLQRLFPFNRGLFEDKVANLWYCLSVIVDIRQLYAVDVLAKISLLLTLLLLVPSAIVLLTRSLTAHRMTLALVNCSLAFFLASFQVHEKSILLPLVPSIILLSTEPLLITWFQVLGCFSMFPLLIRDGLRIPYFAMIAVYVAMSYLTFGTGIMSVLSEYHQRCKCQFLPNSLKYLLVILSVFGMIVLHGLEAFLVPPARLPDLHAALFSIYGAANLAVIYLLTAVWLFALPDEELVASDNKKRE